MSEHLIYIGKCPDCGGMAAKERGEGNFGFCVDCGCVVYKYAYENEPSWVTNYWRQVPKEWKKLGVEE